MQKFYIRISLALLASFVSGCSSSPIKLELDIDRDNLRNSDLDIITPYQMDTDLKIKEDEMMLEFTWDTQVVSRSISKTIRRWKKQW